ncbi:MAG: nitrite/sulfite reductase [Proteobacteria bacterium]|nr:nitrite/sulfite reductase [Pseudomonadota bacterium]
MYQYDEFDRSFVAERVAEFRDQTRRFLAGELSEDDFRPLRLRNGLYIQKHAPMLRVAIPYGLLATRQLRMLAHIARRYDRGFGHFSTRQNIQFNWPELAEVPDILAELATVDMHAIQTSGNCIRNVTADHLAGVAGDELEDPRPWCELIRQWSTLHPEFTYLPRKFKIAVSGAANDRAVTAVHDIGLRLVRAPAGDRDDIGFEVMVGGGLGRMPIIGKRIREWLPQQDLLAYLDAILRVYNRHGRRDNIHRARIKVLVKSLGIGEFARQVEAEFAANRDAAPRVDAAMIARLRDSFRPPAYLSLGDIDASTGAAAGFAAWYRHNTRAHKVSGYRVVFISLKKHGEAPGDMTARQMDALADLADHYSFGEVRVTHDQNLVLADVPQRELRTLHAALAPLGLATPNIGTLTDMICCPGLDFCSLANAGSIGIAKQIHEQFDDLDYLYDLGEIQVKMSGCMNACGHHHVGHIGILGVDKHGEEWYQITLGGSPSGEVSLGEVIGPSVPKPAVADTLARIVDVYVEQRETDGESFLQVVRRIGIEPFKERAYAPDTVAA